MKNIIIILIIFCCKSCCYTNFSIPEKTKYKSKLRITLFDNSLSKENTSVRLVIDSIEVLKMDSISYKNNYFYNLTQGTHFIEISKADGQLKLIDSIKVEEGVSEYLLWINYYYYPNAIEEREIYLAKCFEKYKEDSNLTLEEKHKILDGIEKKLKIEDIDTISRKRGRYFQTSFMKRSSVEIE